jgi:hypothetical protein
LTDGLIFTPDAPYKPRGCAELFKWKYPDMVCVVDGDGQRVMMLMLLLMLLLLLFAAVDRFPIDHSATTK